MATFGWTCLSGVLAGLVLIANGRRSGWWLGGVALLGCVAICTLRGQTQATVTLVVGFPLLALPISRLAAATRPARRDGGAA